MLPARWYRVCRLAWNPLPACRRPRPCRGPYRGRFRSDNHATVLRLHNTQPKDRRAYNAPYRIPCKAVAGGRQEGDSKPGGRRGTSGRGAWEDMWNLNNNLFKRGVYEQDIVIHKAYDAETEKGNGTPEGIISKTGCIRTQAFNCYNGRCRQRPL